MNFIYTKGKGVIVGDALTVLSPSKGWWEEGDEKIYIDEKDIRHSYDLLSYSMVTYWYGLPVAIYNRKPEKQWIEKKATKYTEN